MSCRCGCGQPTRIAVWNNASTGYVAGQPVPFVKGHGRRGTGKIPYVIDEHGCWIFQGAKSNGYGIVRRLGKNYRAHRLKYEELVGPIPEGLHIDHTCRVRACVNPDHLEPVTQAENNQRSWDARRVG